VFYKLGYLQKAVEYFEKAIETDPEYERACDYKIVTLMKKGERNKAFKFVNKIRGLKQKTLSRSKIN